MPVILARVAGVRHPEVEAALQREWPDYEEWIIDPANDYEYGELIREAWTGESDLVIVEQDVVAPPGSIRALLDCHYLWCAHHVHLGNNLWSCVLGLTKFSRRLQLAHPEVGGQHGPLAPYGMAGVHWRSVDSALIRHLEFAGLGVHPHSPRARHLHYPEPASS